MFPNFKKVLLVVLDGFGIASPSPGNAVTRAGTKALDSLVNNFPCVSLQAAGPNVGLAMGEPGNSEVGHVCMGAGRIVLQDSPRIDQSITSGEFYQNLAFLQAIDHVKKHQSKLHLLGLIGSGGVHASQLHLYALLTLAAGSGLREVYLHCITDGRDTEQSSARGFLKELEKKIIQLRCGKIASLMGRFYAMDRAEHWDLTEAAFKALVFGEGEMAESPLLAIENYYERSIYDETLPPTLIVPLGGRPVTIGPGDAVIFFNFRTDRATQLTAALSDPESTGMSQKYSKLEDLFMVTMTEYSDDLPVVVAYPKIFPPNVLSEVLSGAGKKQFHVSETEKYPHITFFFNNGHEEPFPNEVWEQVRSSANYQDLYRNVPQMSALELTRKLLTRLQEPFDFYLVNYANPDMVAHTGSLEASVKAVATIDQCLGMLAERVFQSGDTAMIITGDHGNVEELNNINTGRVEKSHSTNPVPMILVGTGLRLPKSRTSGYLYLATQVPEGNVADIAPTILEIFGMTPPAEMTGISLLPGLVEQLEKAAGEKNQFFVP